jgi:glycosyltransferase involved in cell wall biosynthesis
MTEQQRPKISVIISSYNHAQYLPECLDSILTQTYQDFEIVVVDDGSKDNSHEILVGYQEKYPDKVHYFWHPDHANKGISISCNLAISKAAGMYLAWTGSDDAWYPEKLARQVAVMESNANIGMVYSQMCLFDGNGNSLPGKIGIDITNDESPVVRLFAGNWIPASTVLIRKTCLEQIGLFDNDLVYSDWDLFIRLVSRWKTAYINDPLARYRLHGKNISAGIETKVNLRANIAVLVSLRVKSRTDSGLLGTLQNRAFLELWLANSYFMTGENQLAVDCVRNAFMLFTPLHETSSFISSWLKNFSIPGYQNPEKYQADKDFTLWILQTICEQQISPNQKYLQHMTFAQYVSSAIMHYQAKDWKLIRENGFNALKTNPQLFIEHRSIRNMFFESIIGSKLFKKLRFLKHNISLRSTSPNMH